MTNAVTIVDYGRGNILSVSRALESVGASVTLTDDPVAIAAAERLLLPGVGAFGDAMATLQARNLVAPLQAFAETGRPFLGICLGMQLMLDESEEFGSHAGLGLIPGRVQRIPVPEANGVAYKVPHVGWNRLIAAGADWTGTPLADTADAAAVYFVHSYEARPDEPAHRIADCVYGGHRIAAVIGRDNMIGCQFHPEKSGETGLGILKRFLGGGPA